jgi:hypothetical protein
MMILRVRFTNRAVFPAAAAGMIRLSLHVLNYK